MTSPITLDAIQRKKNFAAADELLREPLAISYTVNKLDITLFDRSKCKAELTAVGKMLVEQGRLI